MKAWLTLTLLICGSSCQAASYTAKQVCSALVRGEFFKLKDWKRIPPMDTSCATLPISIFKKTEADINSPFYENMIDYLPNVNFVYTNGKRNLSYQLTVFSHKTPQDADIASKYFQRSSKLYIFRGTNFNVALILVTQDDADAILEESYQDMVKTLGKEKADDLFKRLNKSFGLDKPQLPSLIAIPQDIIDATQRIIRGMK